MGSGVAVRTETVLGEWVWDCGVVEVEIVGVGSVVVV